MLRRAAELDREHQPAAGPPLLRPEHEPRLDAGDLERIAAESGLSAESVRRAIDELHGGALEEEPPRGMERLVAGESASARRTFDEAPELLEQRLSAALSRTGLVPVDRAPHATRWEPAQGVAHTLRRVTGLGGNSIFIGSAVESGVYAVPGERTCATLRGDARNLLTPIATLTGLLLAFPAGIALLVVLAMGLRWGFDAQHLLGFLLVLAAWVALTALITRGVAKRRVRKLRRKLEQLLAQLAGPMRLPQ